jgi:hypothetical protein
MINSHTSTHAAQVCFLDKAPAVQLESEGLGAPLFVVGKARRPQRVAPVRAIDIDQADVDDGISMREAVERGGAYRDSFERSHRSHLGSTKPASRRGGWESFGYSPGHPSAARA